MDEVVEEPARERLLCFLLAGGAFLVGRIIARNFRIRQREGCEGEPRNAGVDKGRTGIAR